MIKKLMISYDLVALMTMIMIIMRVTVIKKMILVLTTFVIMMNIGIM